MSERTYSCPYCNKRFSRIDMPTHLENKHMELLPQGFTPLRMTFHIVNNKPVTYTRPCRICGGKTDWDENKGRYNFLCNKKSCHDAWTQKMKDTMGDKMGASAPTKTADGQAKMLKARKISGTYKFSDGGERSYCGSYEKKALEFFDTVLEAKSEDIATPGPVLQYDFEGKKHIYISDIFYIPYNLVIEVKDGGNHPNTSEAWSETRRKKIAKEDYIIKHTDYNYLRLTDNDFSQLLSVFADLKMHLLEDDKNRVIHVNEDATTIGAFPPAGTNQDGIVVVNYLKNNVFAEPEFAVANSPKLSKLITQDEWNKLKVESVEFLEDCRYSTYFVKCNREEVIHKLISEIGNDVSSNYIYETVFGHSLFSNDQILFENNATPYRDFYQCLQDDEDRITKLIKGE